MPKLIGFGFGDLKSLRRAIRLGRGSQIHGRGLRRKQVIGRPRRLNRLSRRPSDLRPSLALAVRPNWPDGQLWKSKNENYYRAREIPFQTEDSPQSVPLRKARVSIGENYSPSQSAFSYGIRYYPMRTFGILANCIGRQIRRRVLHALGKTGKFNRSPQWTGRSYSWCKELF